MKIIDCSWEQINLQKRTVEITIEKNDKYVQDVIVQSVNGYDYAVVKVPMDMPEFNYGLSEMGFTCIETQMNVEINYDSFDFSKVAFLFNDTSFKIVDNHNDLASLVSNIHPGMFDTDRISIDPYFGPILGNLRYINWILSEYEKKTSLLVKVFYKNVHVGFMLFRIINDTLVLLLNGLYNKYKGKGLGLLTPSSPMMFVKKKSLLITKEITSISSNNIAVVKLYNRLNFQLANQKYVFVKHF